MNDFDFRLGTALHDRVADVRPDLEHLLTASRRAGVRIRRRRRVGVSLAGAAGVAAVAVGAALISGGGAPPVDARAGFAADPSATTSDTGTPRLVVGMDLTTPSGTKVDVQAARQVPSDKHGALSYGPENSTRLAGPRSGVAAEFALVLPMSYGSEDVRWLKHTFRGQVIAVDNTPDTPLADGAPAEVTAKGWTCEWFLSDDNAACTSTAGGTVRLVIRNADDHDEWITYGKGAGSYITEAHGGIFITVQGGWTAAETQAIGKSLRWVS